MLLVLPLIAGRFVLLPIKDDKGREKMAEPFGPASGAATMGKRKATASWNGLNKAAHLILVDMPSANSGAGHGPSMRLPRSDQVRPIP